MILRPYQHEAVNATLEALQTKQSALVVMATGLGKTVTFAEIARRVPGRVLVLAHREELIQQAASKIRMVTGENVDIEMASDRADMHIYRKSKIVVASVQSLHAKRIKRFKPEAFQWIITDEAHHAPAASYRRIYSHFPAAKHIGVTATPDRSDEKALGLIFECNPFTYDIHEAVLDGYLVPVKQQTVVIESLDLSGVHKVAGDFNARELSERLQYEETMLGIADALIKLAKWYKTIVFTVSKENCELCTEIINRYRPNAARFVHDGTPKDERRQILADYRAGLFQYLVNVGVFTEGFDEPSIEMVAVARPTQSRSLYSQMLGRGTRSLPGIIENIDDADARRNAIATSDKPALHVLDFSGNAGKHKLVTAADVLGGNYEDDIVEEAKEIIRKGGRSMDVDEAMQQAQHERAIERERKKYQLSQVRHEIKGEAEFTTRTVDAFDVLAISPWRKPAIGKDEPATAAQTSRLEQWGVNTKGLSKRQAQQLMGEMIRRRQSGLCTYKQAKVLKKYGYDADVSYEQARTTIDAIAANGWKRPREAAMA